MIVIYFIFYIIIGAEFLYPFSIRYLGLPELPTLTIQAIILLVFTVIYLSSFISNKKLNISNASLLKYLYLFIGFLLIIVISAFLNSNNFLLVIKSVVSYSVIYLFLFLAVLELDMDEKKQTYLIKFIYALILLQIPVSLYQYLFLHYSTADSNSGTIGSANLGGTGIVGILIMFLQAFIVASILVKGFHVKRIILFLLSYIPIVAGGVRIGLFLSPLIVIVTIGSFYLFNPKIEQKKYFRGIALTFAFISVIIILIIFIIPNTKFSKYLDLTTVTNTNNFNEYNGGNVAYSRTLPYTVLFKYTFKDDINYLIGMGNAEITRSSSANTNNAKLQNVSTYPDAVLLLASNGILGISIIILIILLGMITLKKYIEIETSRFMSIVAYSFIPATLIVFISIFYTSAWSSQICLSYWVILAILFQRYSVLQRANGYLLKIKDVSILSKIL